MRYAVVLREGVAQVVMDLLADADANFEHIMTLYAPIEDEDKDKD